MHKNFTLTNTAYHLPLGGVGGGGGGGRPSLMAIFKFCILIWRPDKSTTRVPILRIIQEIFVSEHQNRTYLCDVNHFKTWEVLSLSKYF